MPQINTLEAQLESTLESVDQAEEMVQNFARENGFSDDDVHQIGMAVRESVVNAVVHGNCFNSHKKVSLSLEASAGRLTITIEDQGKGFSYDRVPDPLAEENLLKKSGRGLFLMRAFMDEVRVNRRSPEGIQVVMVKKSSPTNY